MTITEAGKLVDKGEQTIRRAIKAGKLKAVLINGHYEISKDDLSRYQGVSQSDSLFDSQKVVTDSQAIVMEKSLSIILLEKDVVIELLKEQLTEKDKQISQQQAIIMQLSRNQQIMLETPKEKRSWLLKLFKRTKESITRSFFYSLMG
jgi:excisionase family DNA binding protein